MSTYAKSAKFVGGAVWSSCRTYRYFLNRGFLLDGEHVKGKPPLVVVMLNPSTADENTDDPTIRRVQGFARRWGHSGARILNLFAYRSTDPKALAIVDDPVGPVNDEILRTELRGAVADKQTVLAAWGAGIKAAGPRFATRPFTVLHLIDGVQWICLGKTAADGHPTHPLYIPANREPVRFGRLGGDA